MTFRAFNTLGRRIEELKPIEPGHVRLYTCGPTVYNVAHIGNLRTFLWEDVLARHLRSTGLRVTQVMNLTDVDDKTIKGATEAGLSLSEFTGKYADLFFRDIDRLGLQRAERYPRATEHIPEMLEITAKLLERGHAYESEGSVYFRISTFPAYGQLSGIDLSQARRSDRVADDEYEKEDIKDFVLWKAAKPGEPTWDSPWGPGRPGWHVECSAMSMKYFGPHFDIHTGAVDNIFPHHENEIAQSEAATGEKFVDLWMHAEHLIVDGEKMAKSKGNFYTLDDVLARKNDPVAVRYLLLSVPYRKKLNFTWEALTGAASAVERIRSAVARIDEAAAAGGDKPGALPGGRARGAVLGGLHGRARRRPEHGRGARRALHVPARDQRGPRREHARRRRSLRRGGRAPQSRPRPRRPARRGRRAGCRHRGDDRGPQRRPPPPRLRRVRPDPRRSRRPRNRPRGRPDRHEVEAGVN